MDKVFWNNAVMLWFFAILLFFCVWLSSKILDRIIRIWDKYRQNIALQKAYNVKQKVSK